MTDVVNIHDAKTHFSRLVERASRGERITIARDGVPVAMLVALEPETRLKRPIGIDLVMAAAGFDAAIQDTDLVITGEGRVDEQTAFGKTAMGVAIRARAAGVRCLAIGGTVTPEGRDALAAVGAEAVGAHDGPITLDDARAAGVAPIEAAAHLAARTLT